jgi:hypothetical protein
MIQDDATQNVALDNRVRSGADKFYIIAGLAVLSSIIYAVNPAIYLPLGLAGTQLLADIARGQALDMRVFGGLAALVFLGIFVLSAYYARKGELWAFILGGAVYLVDAVLLLLLGDWFAAAVHGFFLYYIVRGLFFLQETG